MTFSNDKQEHIKSTSYTATDLKFELLRYSDQKLDHFISTCNLIEYRDSP